MDFQVLFALALTLFIFPDYLWFGFTVIVPPINEKILPLAPTQVSS